MCEADCKLEFPDTFWSKTLMSIFERNFSSILDTNMRSQEDGHKDILLNSVKKLRSLGYVRNHKNINKME
jgi:hypothetical protein